MRTDRQRRKAELAALAEAAETDVDEELLLRALLGSLCEAYRERMGPEDLKAILSLFSIEKSSNFT